MRYYFDINTYIVTTVSGASNTLTRRATLRLHIYIYIAPYGFLFFYSKNCNADRNRSQHSWMVLCSPLCSTDV